MLETAALSVVFLLIGALIGFLAQRSRMCFVAGLRDYILVRDAELLLGLFSFLVTVWLLTSLFYAFGLLRQGMPEYGDVEVRTGLSRLAAGNMQLKNLTAIRVLGGAESSMSLAGVVNTFFFVTLAGGWLIGLLSVFAGGCVLRQHVLCAQGSRNALFYLLGFYAAAPVYYLFLVSLLSRVFD